jgi:hypothetical protein
MIEYSLVPTDRLRKAYEWHRDFAARDDHILPRQWDEYAKVAEARQLWCAMNDSTDFLGLAYSIFDSDAWELGGLMVAPTERRSGLGSTLAHVTLGHLLFSEDPLRFNKTVMLHIHIENTDVIPLARDVLGFRMVAKIKREWHSAKPGSRAVTAEGYEFHLVKPDSLLRLANWCDYEHAKGTRIVFSEPWQSLTLWAAAFREMAKP